jgi:hypothetical protein
LDNSGLGHGAVDLSETRAERSSFNERFRWESHNKRCKKTLKLNRLADKRGLKTRSLHYSYPHFRLGVRCGSAGSKTTHLDKELRSGCAGL